MLFWVSRADAQATPPPADRPKSAGPTFYADFGFGGKIPTERWSPITVWVQAEEKAIGGVIVARFVQDATQKAEIVVPFAATPGRSTPVQIVAALPDGVTEVTLTMLDQRGRRLGELTYSAVSGRDAALLPTTLTPAEGLLVCVGRTSLPEAVRAWTSALRPMMPDERSDPWNATQVEPGPMSERELESAWQAVHAASIEPELLPVSWIAYEGVSVLVVEADTIAQADPRAVDAVHTWVEGGGRLVILTGAAGPAWRGWLAPGSAGDLVEVGEAVVGPLPRECAEAISREVMRDGQDRLPGEGGGAEGDDRPVPAPAARETARRVIRLTDRARADGWRERWVYDGDRGPRGAALAEGPVGFGWVVVMGLEPRTASAVLSARSAGAVWRDAIEAPATAWFEAHARDSNTGLGVYYDARETQQAVLSLLNRFADVPVVGDAIFLAIAACMIGLALLVGPIDYFVLRRFGAGQRSWMTALAWIGGASLGAYLAPTMMRSGPTQLTRVTAIDRIVPPPDRVGDAPTTCQTGLTGVFASQSGTARFTDTDRSSWWRGVSAIVEFGPRRQRAIGNVSTFQGASDGPGGGGANQRGNPLEAVGLGLWTFRTFMDHSRPACAIDATVDRDGDDWVLAVRGLPEGVRVRQATIRVGGVWYVPGDAPPHQAGSVNAGRWVGRVSADGPLADAPVSWQRAGHGWMGGDDTGSAIDRPGVAASLPGAIERSTSIDHRVASGRWAGVYLHLDGWASDAPIDWASRSSRTAVMRLVVPLDEADRVAPTEVAPVTRHWPSRPNRRGVRPVPVPPPAPAQPEEPAAPDGQDKAGKGDGA